MSRRDPTASEQEDGLALITVLFAVLILTGLATLFVARTTNESRFSGQSQRFESAIHIAEAGADGELAQANADASYLTENPDAPGTGYTLPANPTQDQERQMVLDWALAANDNPAGGTTQRDGGTYFGVRPEDASGDPLDVIYSVGFVPELDRSIDTQAELPANTQIRVVKYLITQDFFSPAYALHTGGALKFGGNAQIKSDGCTTDPEKCDADIQVNGALTNPGASSSVEGEVRVAGGDCPTIGSTGGCVDQNDGVEPEPLPEISARQFYDQLRYDSSGDVISSDFTPDQGGQDVQWFDLCPDGRVYEPSPAGPCQSAEAPVWPNGAQTNWLGWTFSNGAWKATAVSAGIFYVYQSDAEINGSAGTDTRAVSIFVESDPANASTSGSISITGNPKMEAAFPDVLFIADRDVNMRGVASGGTSTYSGFISAYEQMNLTGTVTLNGALLVQDLEDVHPEVTRNTASIDGNLTLNYDRTLAIDLTGYYTITHWSEL